MFPMLDETLIRTTFVNGTRSDNSWLALSSVIITLGCTVLGDEQWRAFYQERCARALGQTTCSSGSLESLQALILWGGSYAHYINPPITSYLVLGKAFRMAVVLSLHRNSAQGTSRYKPADQGSSLSHNEVRNRTWWCLIIADVSFGSMVGRPKCDGWDPLTMNTSLPSTGDDDLRTPGLDNDWYGMLLNVSIKLAAIGSRTEHRLAHLVPMAASEINTIRQELQTWQKFNLEQLRDNSAFPARLKPFLHLQTRCSNLARIAISRTHLVRLAEANVDVWTTYTDVD